MENSKENETKQLRFRVACRMLRNAGHLDAEKALPGQKRGESLIDYLVRAGLAIDKYTAAEALIVGRGLQSALNEIVALPEIEEYLSPTQPPANFDRQRQLSTGKRYATSGGSTGWTDAGCCSGSECPGVDLCQ